VSAPSLRRRAAIVAAMVCAGVMALGGGAAWWWMRSTWLATFEQAMHERANALGLQVELDDRDEVATGDPALSGRPRESYAIWNADGDLLHASEGIQGLGFQRQSQVGWQFTDHGTFRTVWVRVTLGWHEDDDQDVIEEQDLKREKNIQGKERDEADKNSNKDNANERDKKSDQERVKDPDEQVDENAEEREWVLVALAWDASGLYRSLTTLACVLAGHLVLAALLGAAALWYVLGVTLRPVITLARTIDGIQPGALVPALATLDLPSEIRPVAERVDALVQRLHAAMERERAFSGAVAHELRTPLAGLRAQLERWQQQSTDTSAATASHTCNDIVLHLQALVEKLLLLTRVQSGQLRQERIPVDLVGLVEVCWEHHVVQAGRRGLQVTLDLKDCPPVESDRDLLSRMIDNVLHNAVAHADQGGTVNLSCQLQTIDEKSVVIVTCDNSGCRLPAGDVHYATNRFWRGDAARTGDGLHCGLGLSVCVELASFLNIDFRVVATAERHFIATMIVPC
jgi:signal transduction histidine kinase